MASWIFNRSRRRDRNIELFWWRDRRNSVYCKDLRRTDTVRCPGVTCPPVTRSTVSACVDVARCPGRLGAAALGFRNL